MDQPIGPAPEAAYNQPPPSVTQPPPELTRSPLSDGEWHRLHPLTPLLRGGLVLLVIIGVIVSNLRDRLVYVFLPWLVPDIPADEIDDWDTSGDPIDWIIVNNLYVLAIVAVLVVLVLIVGWFYLSWRFHEFRITGEVVEVKSGILFRTQRRARLDRVQGVNLTRPMIARILGMAKLEVVGAGTDANVKLEYLSTANAEAVRADILRLASGRRLSEASVRGTAPASRVGALSQTVSRGITGLIEGDDLTAEEPASVVHIPTGRLVASHIISPMLIWLLLALAATIIGAVNGTPWLLLGFIPAIIGLGGWWISMLLKALRYAIAPTPDGVRITSGLLTTVTEIVPPGRVHAVEVTQSILWRPFGWWSIRINRLSGRSATDSSTDQFMSVLPVGTLSDVERVLRLLLPSVAPEDWPIVVGPGVSGSGDTGGFTTTPGRARIIRLLSWRRNGFLLLPVALLLRRGLIWRKLAILPLARLQSIGVYQGPVDRMLGVAAVRGHVVPGPVYPNVSAIDRDAALELFDGVARGSVAAAASDHSHRWAEDPGADSAVQSRQSAGLGLGDPQIGASERDGAGSQGVQSRRSAGVGLEDPQIGASEQDGAGSQGVQSRQSAGVGLEDPQIGASERDTPDAQDAQDEPGEDRA